MLQVSHRKIFYSIAELDTSPVRIRYFVEIPGGAKYCIEDFRLALEADSSTRNGVGSSDDEKAIVICHFANEETIKKKIGKPEFTEVFLRLMEVLHKDFETRHPDSPMAIPENYSNSTAHHGKESHKPHQLKPKNLSGYFIPDLATIECAGKTTTIRVCLQGFRECMYSVSDILKAIEDKDWKHRLKLVFHHLHHRKHIKTLHPVELFDVTNEDFVDETGLLKAIGSVINSNCGLKIEVPLLEEGLLNRSAEQPASFLKGNPMATEYDVNKPGNLESNSESSESADSEDKSFSASGIEVPFTGIQKATGESTFKVGNHTFRYFYDKQRNGWFCAQDICNFLGHYNIRKELDKYGVEGVRQFLFNGQPMLFVPADGFEIILSKSRRPQAERLLFWIYDMDKDKANEPASQNANAELKEALQHAFEHEETSKETQPNPQTVNPTENIPTNLNQNATESTEMTNNSENDQAQRPPEYTLQSSSNTPEEKDQIPQENAASESESNKETMDAFEIYRRIKIKNIPFDQWIQNQIDTLGLKEDEDYSRDFGSGKYLLAKPAVEKIVNNYAAEVLGRGYNIIDKDVNSITVDGKLFRFLYDQSHNKWYCADDIRRFLGAQEVQNAIDTYGTPDDPVTVSTRVADYLCFSEDTFKRMLMDSPNEKAKDVYKGLFGEGMRSEVSGDNEVSQQNVSPQPEPSEDFVLTSEPKPSDQSSFDLRQSSQNDENLNETPEETTESPVPKSVDQAISPKIGTFNGKYFWVVDAEELHSYLEPPKPYPLWIKDLIDFYGYIENTDYVGDREAGEFLLSLPMAREIAMTSPSDRGRETRIYLAAYSNEPIPDSVNHLQEPTEESPSDTEKQELSENAPSENSEPQEGYTTEIETEAGEIQPVAEENIVIAESTSESPISESQVSSQVQKSQKIESTLTIAEVARKLGVGPTFLTKYLQDIGWLLPDSSEPKIYIIRKGLMSYNLDAYEPEDSLGVVTEDGLAELRKKLVNLGIIQFESLD